MQPYLGFIGIVAVISLTILAWCWVNSYEDTMLEEGPDEYEAEQARLSWEANKEYGIKPNKLTTINAVKEK